MKMHLADSGTPLSEGGTINAVCGKPIPNAAFGFMWDDMRAGDLFLESLNSLTCCQACVRKAKDSILGRYVYGVHAGEEAKQMEGAA